MAAHQVLGSQPPLSRHSFLRSDIPETVARDRLLRVVNCRSLAVIPAFTDDRDGRLHAARNRRSHVAETRKKKSRREAGVLECGSGGSISDFRNKPLARRHSDISFAEIIDPSLHPAIIRC